MSTIDNISAGPSSTRLNQFSVAIEDAIEGPHVTDTVDLSAGNDLDVRFWCPNTVYQLREQFSDDTAEFFFSLPRKPAALRNHADCTARNCTANSTGDEDYRSSHFGKCSQNCEFRGPEIEQVVKIIQNGGIPLISLQRATDGTLVISVVRATSKLKYFAVSHVWSGGMGNPVANALPLCQLVRLYELGIAFKGRTKERWFGDIINARHAESLFWMDTLCIPVGNDNISQKLRAQAINTMAQIYAKARAIIILDPELQQFPFDQDCIATNLGRLICSAWMSRCWTFQEGALAAEWLVQFEDGLYSMDVLQNSGQRYEESNPSDARRSGATTDEIQRYYRELPRFREIEGQKTFLTSLHKENIFLFRLVWNNLCIRNTTKREDLVSILSVVLGLRPRDIFSLELERRLLSIFSSQKVLPISFLFRERPLVERWCDANRWLPSTIEDHPIDNHGGSMWRRSPDENFFVFETTKSGYGNPTDHLPLALEDLPFFYFSRSKVDITETLVLINPERMQRRSTVRVQLSPLLSVPKLDLCVITGPPHQDLGTVPTSHGALFGVRERTPEYVQLFYLCPVEFKSTGSLNSSTLESNTILYQEELTPGIEYVFEHDFSGASGSLYSRPNFTVDLTAVGVARVLGPPFAIRGLSWAYVYVAFLFAYFPYVLWWHAVLFGVIFFTRFGAEFGISATSLQQLEFDEWLADLHEQRVQVLSYDFYLYPRPFIVYSILVLGPISWIALTNNRGWVKRFPVLFMFAAAVATEASQIPVSWLLEIYSRAPKGINILRWFANSQDWYYQRYYAKSYFTALVEHLISAAYVAVHLHPWRSNVMSQCSEPLEHGPALTPTIPAVPGIGTRRDSPRSFEYGDQNVNVEPWIIDRPRKFVPSHVNYTFAGKFSLRPAGEGYAPFQYLGGIMVWSYGVIFAYYIFCFSSITVYRATLDLDVSYTAAIPFITVAALAIEANLLLKRVSLPCKVLGWQRLLYRDVPRISDINISIHYSPRTTLVLIGVWCALVSLLFMPGLIAPEVSVWGVLQLGSLLLRWFVELYARFENESDWTMFLTSTWDGEVGTGNEDLDICWHRFYATSRLTLLVDAAVVWARERIPRMWTAIRTLRYWLACMGSGRRNVPVWARGRRGVATDYTDDGDYDVDAYERSLLSEYHDSADG